MTGYFGSGGGMFTPQKPGPLNLAGGTTGPAGTGLFAQKSPGVGTTGLAGLAQPGTFSGMSSTQARQGHGFGFGGTTGLGGTAGLGGTHALGGTAGLGGTHALGGTAGLGGTHALGGTAGLGGTHALGGTAGLGGTHGLGGTAGLGGTHALGGTLGLGGTHALGGTTGMGTLGGTAGLGGAMGMGGMTSLGTLGGGTAGLGGTTGMGTLGGTAGLGGLGGAMGMGGMTGLGTLGGGTTGLGGMGGTAGLGGTSSLASGFPGSGSLGVTGYGGIGTGLGGTTGMGTLGGGTTGLGSLGGTTGLGLGGTAGLGGTGFTTGLGGTTGLGTSMTGLGSSLGGGFPGMGRGTTGISGIGATGGLGGQTGLGLGMGTSGGLGRGLGVSTGYSSLGGGATGGLFGPKGQTNPLYNPSAMGKAQSHNDQLQLTAMALSSPTIFGDERDTVVTKLNQLQVYWGSGKGICNHTGATVEFTETNPFFVMKSVGYIKLPTTEDKEGLVRIVVSKTESEVIQLKSSICNTLRQIINDANVTPVIDSTYGIIETNLSEIRFYLLDGNKNRITTRQVVAFFSTNDMTNKLRVMGVQELHPCLRPSDASIKAYLEKTPEGFDPNVWSQAVKNNPSPQEMIPVPILGFQALKARALAQKGQSEQHESRLKLIGKEIANLQQTQTSIVSKYEQAKRKQLELNHRLLKVMVQQETSRKSGHSIQEDEEQLRIHFEMILNELTSPTGVKSELTEMLSMMRLTLPNTQYKENNYKLGEDVTLGIQMHLTDQQERIENLMKIIMEDMEDLNIIQEALVDGRM